MEPGLLLTVAQWREYLRGYSAELLAADELRDVEERRLEGVLTEDQCAAERLGFEPATERQVLAVVQRLRVWLPPTFRMSMSEECSPALEL
jgi:hypothetical protein